MNPELLSCRGRDLLRGVGELLVCVLARVRDAALNQPPQRPPSLTDASFPSKPAPRSPRTECCEGRTLAQESFRVNRAPGLPFFFCLSKQQSALAASAKASLRLRTKFPGTTQRTSQSIGFKSLRFRWPVKCPVRLCSLTCLCSLGHVREREALWTFLLPKLRGPRIFTCP